MAKLTGVVAGSALLVTACHSSGPSRAPHLQKDERAAARTEASAAGTGHTDVGTRDDAAPGGSPHCRNPEVPWVRPATVVGRRGGSLAPATLTVDTVLPWSIDVGQDVAVLAVPSALGAQKLAVTEVTVQPPIDGDGRSTWVVAVDAASTPLASLEPRTWGDSWSAAAILVCPAGPVALVDAADVGGDLPVRSGASLQTLWAAVDLTGDGTPDAEIFRFWCDTPTVSTGQPQPGRSYVACESIYRRSGRKHWKLVSESRDD